MKQGRATDIADGRGRLAAIVPVPAVHVEVAGGLRIADARSSHALLRCAQEFVTNSIRHAGARNIWIALRPGAPGVELTARDAAAAPARLRPGPGLPGVRGRPAGAAGCL